ncbi:TetR/AcrR family transcriptional regulator [Amycolatopsis sp. K13G38]|uniref:TetR/AcrR family transcriptional regulator n=1 Tax=Amycolatopsis acididurans TaxID=2724524 RepID=A0ABX1JAC1_9PSEU|nr:TetR/AcrR family transcriptional regulator [Amycolatopsis acididurans]NKQ55237.1 TetR/AcrR family transcriptional regulator [Amycolatopsis acididurans]
MDEDSHTTFRPYHAAQSDSSADARSSARASNLADTRARQTTARVSDDALLDAARRCVLAVGLRRATLAEIARTAKVSRMTLYRRFPDVRSVLSALMTREFGALLHKASAEGAEAPTARERLIRGAIAAVRLLSDDELMRTVIDVDTELLMPYVVQRFGGTQKIGEQVITALVRDGQQDGSIRRGDVAAQARTILLVVQSFVLSLRPATADMDATALLDELERHLDSALRP